MVTGAGPARRSVAPVASPASSCGPVRRAARRRPGRSAERTRPTLNSILTRRKPKCWIPMYRSAGKEAHGLSTHCFPSESITPDPRQRGRRSRQWPGRARPDSEPPPGPATHPSRGIPVGLTQALSQGHRPASHPSRRVRKSRP